MYYFSSLRYYFTVMSPKHLLFMVLAQGGPQSDNLDMARGCGHRKFWWEGSLLGKILVKISSCFPVASLRSGSYLRIWHPGSSQKIPEEKRGDGKPKYPGSTMLFLRARSLDQPILKGRVLPFWWTEYQKLEDSLVLVVLVIALVKHTSSFAATSITKYHKLSGLNNMIVSLFIP